MISKGGDNVLRHKKFIVSCLILAVFLESNNYVYGIQHQHRQSNDYQCQEEGFHADPVNCNVYYRCVNWGDNSRLSKFKFECGPGTVYSESKGYICVHPRDSERPECNELTNDLDSSLHYDQSINRQTTMSSSSSWTYGSPLPSTLSPQITTSSLPNGHKKPTKNNYNNNGYPSSNNYPGMANDKPLNNRPHGSSPPSSASGSKECQEEGFKPHPKDCNKFIRCVSNGNSYQQYEFTCGEGTVWDPSANACNHAWAVNREGCGSAGSSQNGQNSGSNDNINDNNNEVNDPENGSNDAASNGQSGHPGSGPGVEENEHEHQGTVDEVPKPPGGLYPPPENPQEPGEENNIPSSPPGYPSQPSYPSQTFPPNEIENSSQPTQPTEPSNEMENSSQPIQPTEPSNEIDKPSQPIDKPSSGSLGPAGSCSEEGFVSDPNDCHKFYRCVQGEGSSLTKYEFTCGEGTAWDQGLLTCNYESSVSSCKGGSNDEGSKPVDNNVSTTVSTDITSTDIASNPSQTEESSMTDKNESTTQLTSTDSSDISGASGVGPNQDNGIPPEQAGGYPMPGAPSDASTTIMPSEENTSSDNSSPDTGSSTSTGSTVPDDSQNEISSMTTPESSHASTDMSGSCTEEGFFSDPQDCHKFIRCVSSGKKSFIKYSFTCGEGTAWDQNLQTCNYEASVESCGGQSSKPMNEVDSSTPETEKPTEKPPSDSSSSEMPESSSSEAPNESTTEVSSVSSSEDTNNSDATTESEPSSTTPDESTTEVTVSSSEDTNNSDVTTGSEPSTTASSETPEETPSYETGQSPDSESPSTTQAVESSSEATTSTENNVDDNSESPSTTQQTEEQTSVSSSTTTTTTTTTTENSNVDNDTSSITPAGSSESSENTPSTTPSMKPVPSNNSGKCTEEGFHPNPSNCRKFIRCVGVNKGFIKYDFDCGPGTAWDQSLLTCNYIDQVESCKSSGNPSDSGNEKPTSSDGQKPGDSGDTNKPGSNEDNKENTTTENSSVSTTPTSNDSSDCSNKKPNNTIVCNKAGFYPHPTNCAKFYRCVDNGNGFNVYYFDCPPGTNFDPSISVCNYPESIYPARDCSGSSDSGTTPSSVSKPTTQESSSSSTTDSLSSTTQKEEISTDNTETGGETTTQGGEITTVGGDVTTQGGEMTTDGGDMTTEGPDVTTQGEEMTTLSGDMTTEGGDVTTQGEEMTTQSEDVTTQSGEITTQSGEVTTQGDEGGYITPDDGITTTTETKEPGPSTEGATESSDDMTTTESSDDTPITESPPVPITKPSEETTPGEPEETTKTETSTMAAGPLDATPCPIGNLTDEQIVLKCPTGFARHPKHCSLFYQCTTESNMEIKILILRCPDNTTFDEKQIKCLPEEETDEKCTTTKHSERLFRRLAKTSIDPIKVSTASLCPDEGHYPYQKGCSNAFYKCKRDSRNSLQGYLYKCPQDYVYWSVSRRCERANRLPVCSQADYDDNQQINSWQNRTGIPIEDFNLSARMISI
ncbi:mucin-5AC-like isoform X2 [Aphidius gifuensis]|uniref:mucin-5AC-like isoform X2 n=1 Tax=Aphidius gifuensis TaxID=684658 RepID=UPI001CDCEA6C|nr:mucin-5AC-like isoform X2 [Aphidius gifuensis]